LEESRRLCEVAPPSGDTTPVDDGEILEGTIRDEVIAQFLEVGFSPDEANCILDNIDFAAIESLSDPTILLGVFEKCGIPLERLAGLGG
jgi:hypothetical protein